MQLFEFSATGPQQVLVVVHPGSACGSADFNLGKLEAGGARSDLAMEISRWRGPVLIVDGELSDELPSYPELNGAIRNAIRRARYSALPAKRVFACANCTPNFPARVLATVKEMGFGPDTVFHLTGAWWDPYGPYGCINAVKDILDQNGYATQLLSSAIHMGEEWDGEAEEEDEDGEDEALKEGRIKTRRRKLYMNGHCYRLALVLHDLTKWPIVGIRAFGEADPNFSLIDHAGVQMPDGRFLDGRGVHDPQSFVDDMIGGRFQIEPMSRQQTEDLRAHAFEDQFDRLYDAVVVRDAERLIDKANEAMKVSAKTR